MASSRAWQSREPGHPTRAPARAPKAVFEEISPADDLIANWPEHQELRAEIDLVEQMIIEAENEGDEEVLRKLTDYKTTLDRTSECNPCP